MSITLDTNIATDAQGRVIPSSNSANTFSDGTNNVIGVIQGPGGANLAGLDYLHVFNGSAWDRQRGQLDNVTVLASGAQTAGFNGADQTNFNFRGAALLINVSAVSGTLPTLTATVQFKDPVSGVYYTPATGAMVTGSITGVSSTALMIYPGIAAVANAAFNSTLARTWRLVYTIGGTTPSFTFSVGASYLL